MLMSILGYLFRETGNEAERYSTVHAFGATNADMSLGSGHVYLELSTWQPRI